MLPISVCIIAKNEEAVVEECLERLVKFFGEIIFVDTGSTDRTRELALRYTPHVFSFEWIQDFSAARNFSISKAAYDWILCVDCDEYLITPVKGLTWFKQYLADKQIIGRIERRNPQQIGNGIAITLDHVGRLFSKSYYHYEGSIHEQLVRKDGAVPVFRHVPLSFDHMGYADKEGLQRRAERNLSLLLSELEQKGEDPYVLFQVGQCYYSIKQYEEASAYYEKALTFDLDPKLEYVQNMIENYGYCFLNKKQYEQALSLEGVYQEFSGRADFVFLMGLIYMHNGMFDRAIEEFLKAVKIPEYALEGTNSYLAYYNIGVVYECLGREKEASGYYQKCLDYLDYEPAKNRLSLIK